MRIPPKIHINMKCILVCILALSRKNVKGRKCVVTEFWEQELKPSVFKIRDTRSSLCFRTVGISERAKYMDVNCHQQSKGVPCGDTPAAGSRSAEQKLRQICSDFRSLPVLRSPPLVIHCSAAILLLGASSPPAKMWRGFLQTHRGSKS